MRKGPWVLYSKTPGTLQKLYQAKGYHAISTIGSILDGQDQSILVRYVTGPPWAVDSAHSATSARAHAHVVHHATHTRPRGCPVSQRRSQLRPAGHFSNQPLGFQRINPRSSSVQMNYFSVIFLFTLDPVVQEIVRPIHNTCKFRF